MLSREDAWQLLRDAELIHDEDAISRAIRRLAADITARLGDALPLVMPVMGGAVVFTGQLLPLLRFPLEFDYLHVTRYDGGIRGGQVHWKTRPHADFRGRAVLVLDDILDEGNTLAAIRDHLLAEGAASFHSAVFAEKDIGRDKPIRADFVGLKVPDRYVFGFGMDAHEAWRNLPAIYALKS
ncbi:MAG TPA: hypoxanthine-guanine phosphoribosyltransferase [Burkholderiales bacterium]|nr:hypoxanthine-guanine phosphoribosyltransferase [Burkholderiales bacterium]